MGMKYRHLTEHDRIFIRFMLDKRYSKARIEKILKVAPSTIYREVKRNGCTYSNCGQKYCWSHTAHKKYLQRRRIELRLEKERQLREYVHARLKAGWSPCQIEDKPNALNALFPTSQFIITYTVTANEEICYPNTCAASTVTGSVPGKGSLELRKS